MDKNFGAFIDLVWPNNGGFDSPKQGYHVTPGDSGGGTKGGVIEATWQHYVAQGLVSGTLSAASDAQLALVLKADAWGAIGSALPSGLDILVANGRMMTGKYGVIFQQCLGLTGMDVDNDIGPITLGNVTGLDVKTLILALHGNHYRYLTGLSGWGEFGSGWTTRLNAAKAAALALVPSQAVS